MFEWLKQGPEKLVLNEELKNLNFYLKVSTAGNRLNGLQVTEELHSASAYSTESRRK